MSKKTIILAGVSHAVLPLTLGALEDLGKSIYKVGHESPEGMQAYRDVINTALADSDIDTRLDAETRGVTLVELNAAWRTIGVMTGYLKPLDENAAPGEAQAGTTKA